MHAGFLGSTKFCLFRRDGLSSQRRVTAQSKFIVSMKIRKALICKKSYGNRARNTYSASISNSAGMADECRRYHSKLAELLTIKKEQGYSMTIAWVRIKVSFAILRSALLCLRGSRTIRRRNNLNIYGMDIEIETVEYIFNSFLVIGFSNISMKSFYF